MALPTARSARPLPRAVPRLDRTLRDVATVDESRGDATARDPGEGSRREPAWLVELTAQITRSVNAIERVVERVGTMREDNSYLRTVTASLRDALEAERAEAGRRLVEQGRSISQQKRRTAEAERSADALAGMLCDLERQLAGRRNGEATVRRSDASYEGTFRQGERHHGERHQPECLRRAG